MSAVQYYLLDANNLASLLDCLKKACGTPNQHATVSFADGYTKEDHIGLFRTRLTAEQYMDLSTSKLYYPWLEAKREIHVMTDERLGTTYTTVDGSFTHTLP